MAKNDSIYMGTMVKLDIASPIVMAAVNKWQMQHYEIATNVRLAKRFYPTLELGYSGGKTTQGDTVAYNGHGGFFRVGTDICPLKKNPNSPHALLVGVRLGTAVQGYHQDVNGTTVYNTQGTYADCWGEIVAGCQVEIAKVDKTSFYMGWMGRFKCLFTRNYRDKANNLYPVYIPGFGKRDDIGWGVSYHLGWRF